MQRTGEGAQAQPQSGVANRLPWERLAFLSEAGEILSGGTDEQALAKLAELAVPRFADWCLIEAKQDEALEVLTSIHVSRDGVWLARELQRMQGTGGIAAEVLESGKSVRIAHVHEAIYEVELRQLEELRIWQSLGIRSALLVPMPSGGRNLGVLRFFRLESEAPYSVPEREAAEDVGRRAGMLLEHTKLRAELARARQTREQILTTASHELRTPLSALLLQLQSLEIELRPWSDPRQERLLARVGKALKQCHRLTQLTDDLLSPAELGARKPGSGNTPDLADAVEKVAANLAAEASAAGCELVVTAERGMAGRWDRECVERIVANLVSNAIKFAPGSPIAIDVERGFREAIVRVADHGPGIARDDHERIFERFERGDPQNAIPGLGLGLHVARELARLQGGAIALQSQLGRGSVFCLKLPLQPSQSGPSTP